ncbi:MAG: malate/lactate/ureidoglycolate dehydrogenase [Alphaproteobacteria bacterium]|nr:malate/lactate/ureidoglycolate dehydrogenase [Alphaproteobacteria bacterium]
MLISAERLTELTEAIIRHGSDNQAASRQVAQLLVEANLTGHDSHGVGVLPAYMDSIWAGQLHPDAEAEIVSDKGPFLLVDGHRGFGQLVAKQAMELAIERAGRHHFAVLSLRNSFHIGRVGDWASMAAEAGFVSIHYVNVLSPNSLVAPHGGSDARFTTNPHCTAIPASKRHPMFLLDMATSTIAQGKARVAYMKGEAVPDGCLIDHQGRPTNDPTVMFEEPKGALTTMGLHKGFGMALICDILGGSFSGGGAYLPDRVISSRVINNMLAILIDPDVFGDAEAFYSDIDNYTDWIKASPPAPGTEGVLFPGDPERKVRAEREATGIPIDDATWAQLLVTAENVGIPQDEIARIVGTSPAQTD